MACHIFPRLPRRLCLCWLFLVAFAWLAAAPLAAQSFDASHLREPTNLQATWLLQTGDNPAYARPDYDDSHWMRIDPSASLKSYLPTSRPPVIWYRLHVKVAPSQNGLALEEWLLGSAFEIYVNGERLIGAGSIAPYKPVTFDSRLIRRIPDADIATGSLVIAVRIFIAPSDWLDAFPGLYASNLILGQQRALSDRAWLAAIGANGLYWIDTVAGLGLGAIALALFAVQRRQREYLWIFLMAISAALWAPVAFYRLFHNVGTYWDVVRQALEIFRLIFTVLMYFALLRMRMGRWMQILLGITIAGMLFGLIENAVHLGSTLATLVSVVPEAFLLACVIPILLIVHMRRGNREAGILLVPALLLSLLVYVEFVFFFLAQIPALAPRVQALMTMILSPTVGPFALSLNDLSGCFFVLSLTIILVLRSTRTARQQAQIEGELAAAREVQQVILPEAIEPVPGFRVESAYQPATQVGGDFFQILPAPGGGMLLVIGDVAGKGLPAAMLVSVLVGAIRTVAEYTTDPAELLTSLNGRLTGRSHSALATALAAHIAANGAVTLANAGHLPPYLDGCEVEMPGALPLGVENRDDYPVIRFHLPAGSRLTFYSDGIVEAQNAEGELLGFERGRELSTEPATAIVEAATQFGQQDDITVLAIAREAAAATAA